MRIELNSDIYESYITWKGHSSYGTITTVDLSGKVSKTLQRHKNFYIGPFSLENDVVLKLPLEKFGHIRDAFTISGKIEEKKVQVGVLTASDVHSDVKHKNMYLVLGRQNINTELQVLKYYMQY